MKTTVSKIQIIKIFLASSKELREDRDAISCLIRSLNDYYIRKGIYIDLFRCEDEDPKLTGRKQDEYDEEVRNCDIFIGLFWTKAGKFTREEFNVAKQSYDIQKRPAIYIFMKENCEDEDASLTDFKKYLSSQIGHYWNNYSHTDNLKFDFLLHWVKDNPILEMDSIVVRESNICIKDGPALLPVNNLSCFGNNSDFIQLSKDIKRAHENILKYPADESFRNDLAQSKKRKQELENELLAMAKTISVLTTETASDRLKQAASLFEKGDNKGANALLNMKEIVKDIDDIVSKIISLNELSKEFKQALAHHIDELLIKAHSVCALHDKDWEKEAFSIYEKILTYKDYLEENKYIEVIWEYGNFCSSHEHIQKACELFESITSITPMENRVRLWERLGTLYWSTGHLPKSVSCYKNAFEYFDECRASQTPISVETYIALMNNYSILLKKDLGYKDEAIKCYDKAIKVLDDILGKDVESNLHAIIYANKGNSLIEKGEIEAGYSLIQKAYQILLDICNDCNEEGLMYMKLQTQLALANESRKIKKYFATGYTLALDAFQTIKELYNDDNNKYNELLVSIGCVLAQYEQDMQRYQEAIKLCDFILSAIDSSSKDYIQEQSTLLIILDVCYDSSIELHESEKARSYGMRLIKQICTGRMTAESKRFCIFGVKPAYDLIQYYENSEKKEILSALHKIMVVLYEDMLEDILQEEQKNIVISLVYNSYVYLAYEYADLNKYEEAISYFERILNILIKEQNDKEQNLEDLMNHEIKQAIVLDALGVAKIMAEKTEDGQSNILESFRLFEKYKAQLTQEEVGLRVANLNNCANVFIQKGDFLSALNLIEQALSIIPDDLNCLDTCGEILFKMGDFEKARRIQEKIRSIDMDYFENKNTEFVRLSNSIQ